MLRAVGQITTRSIRRYITLTVLHRYLRLQVASTEYISVVKESFPTLRRTTIRSVQKARHHFRRLSLIDWAIPTQETSVAGRQVATTSFSATRLRAAALLRPRRPAVLYC